MVEQDKDLQGRAYITVEDTKPGDFVVVDGDFTCIPAGKVRKISIDDCRLYIKCDQGQHFLDGQLNDNRSHYVGLYTPRQQQQQRKT